MKHAVIVFQEFDKETRRKGTDLRRASRKDVVCYRLCR